MLPPRFSLSEPLVTYRGTIFNSFCLVYYLTAVSIYNASLFYIGASLQDIQVASSYSTILVLMTFRELSLSIDILPVTNQRLLHILDGIVTMLRLLSNTIQQNGSLYCLHRY